MEGSNKNDTIFKNAIFTMTYNEIEKSLHNLKWRNSQKIMPTSNIETTKEWDLKTEIRGHIQK